MSRRADRCLRQQAAAAIEKHLDRRARLFLEEAAALAAERFGGAGAAEMLRDLADHLEENA